MPLPDQVAVPAQHRAGPYQQPHPAKRLRPQPVQQRRQQSAVRRREAHLLPAQLALQHPDLVAQDQDLGVLIPIAREKKAQDREGVGHRQVGQSHQHSRTSCRRRPLRRGGSRAIEGDEDQNLGAGDTSLTCTNEFSAGTTPLPQDLWQLPANFGAGANGSLIWNPGCNLFVDVYGGSTAVGGTIDAYPYNGGYASQFFLTFTG
jgi:hypothetical protein